jgi:hypothetical protein
MALTNLINRGAISSEVVANSVADLKTRNLQSGDSANTLGYSTVGGGGNAPYLCKTAAQATTDGDVIDGYVNHTLNNGNVVVIQTSAPKLSQCGGDFSRLLSYHYATQIPVVVDTDGTASYYPGAMPEGLAVNVSSTSIDNTIICNFTGNYLFHRPFATGRTKNDVIKDFIIDGNRLIDTPVRIEWCKGLKATGLTIKYYVDAGIDLGRDIGFNAECYEFEVHVICEGDQERAFSNLRPVDPTNFTLPNYGVRLRQTATDGEVLAGTVCSYLSRTLGYGIYSDGAHNMLTGHVYNMYRGVKAGRGDTVIKAYADTVVDGAFLYSNGTATFIGCTAFDNQGANSSGQMSFLKPLFIAGSAKKVVVIGGHLQNVNKDFDFSESTLGLAPQISGLTYDNVTNLFSNNVQNSIEGVIDYTSENTESNGNISHNYNVATGKTINLTFAKNGALTNRIQHDDNGLSFQYYTAGAFGGTTLRIEADGRIRMLSLPSYADQAAAAGGLVTHDVYKTPTGEIRIVT